MNLIIQVEDCFICQYTTSLTGITTIQYVVNIQASFLTWLLQWKTHKIGWLEPSQFCVKFWKKIVQSVACKY